MLMIYVFSVTCVAVPSHMCDISHKCDSCHHVSFAESELPEQSAFALDAG